MSGGIILGFAVRGGGEVRLSWDVRREGGGVIFHFLRGGGADLFWNDPLSKFHTICETLKTQVKLIFNFTSNDVISNHQIVSATSGPHASYYFPSRCSSCDFVSHCTTMATQKWLTRASLVILICLLSHSVCGI